MLPVATFAAGWFGASHIGDFKSSTHKNSDSVRSSPGDFSKARADFKALLKIPGPIERRKKLSDFVASLDAGSVRTMLADLEKMPDGPDRQDALLFLTERLVELDPKSALSWAQGLHDTRFKNASISNIFDAWSATNPAAAVAAIAQLPSKLREQVEYASIHNFAQLDPQGALAAMATMPHSIITGSYYAGIYRAWAGSDPTAAAASVINLPPSTYRSQSLAGVARGWAQQDPAAAMAWANSLPAGVTRTDALSAAIQAMGMQDPAAAADYAIKLPESNNSYPGSNSRTDILEGIAANWAVQDPTAVLTWADKNLTGDAFNTAAGAAVKQMGQTDPAAAAAALAQIPDAAVVNKAIPDLATAWAQQDMQGALTWAQSLPTTNDNVRQAALNNILNSWTSTDPASAAAYIQQNLTADPDFSKLATQAATTWAQSDPQAALAWAQSLPPGGTQNTTVVAAITQLANVDPDTAWDDAEQLSGSSQTKALSNVITAIASQDPESAAADLDSLPPGADFNSATKNVAQNWLRQDPDTASDWIGTLPSGTARDGAVTQLISTIKNNDPATAFNWALTLGDPNTRNSNTVNLATAWSAKDPAAAATAAQNALSNLTGLTTAQQTSLQKIVQKASAQN